MYHVCHHATPSAMLGRVVTSASECRLLAECQPARADGRAALLIQADAVPAVGRVGARLDGRSVARLPARGLHPARRYVAYYLLLYARAKTISTLCYIK